MPLIEYVGPHIDGVVIPYGDIEIRAEHGVAIEVSDDMAAGLLEQPANWRAAEPATTTEAAGGGSKKGVTDVP